MPHIYPLVNWSKPVVSLEQEFHKLIGDKYKGDHVISDKLLKFHLKAGGEQWILVHVEVESAAKPNVPERMFVYFYRIFDKREENITALAIYTGDSVPEGCDRFEYEFMGTKVVYQFNTFLVSKVDEALLIEDDSPMALAILAAKYLNDTKNNKELRYRYKLKLIELARKKGWTKEELVALSIHRFNDYLT